MLELGKFSLGMGDRFAHQAAAQLRACVMASEQGVAIVPVWNKSNREHVTIGSEPGSVRAAADAAVKKLGWRGAYHVDADHINLGTVDRFIEPSDFFTIDVASSIGKAADASSIAEFVNRHGELTGEIRIPGVEKPLPMEKTDIEKIAAKYLLAVQEGGRIYRHIAERKGGRPLHYGDFNGRN